MIVLCIHFNLLTRESRTNIWLPWHWTIDENLINTLHVPISWCTIIHISFHFSNNTSYFSYVSDCHWSGSLYVPVRAPFYYSAFLFLFFASSVKMHSNIWILFPFCWLQSWIFIQNKLYSNILSFRTRTSLKKILLIYDFYFFIWMGFLLFPIRISSYTLTISLYFVPNHFLPCCRIQLIEFLISDYMKDWLCCEHFDKS